MVQPGIYNLSRLVTILTVFWQCHSVAFVEEKGTKVRGISLSLSSRWNEICDPLMSHV